MSKKFALLIGLALSSTFAHTAISGIIYGPFDITLKSYSGNKTNSVSPKIFTSLNRLFL